LAVLGLALELLALSTLRADPAVRWRGLRLDSWAALALAAMAGLVCLLLFLKDSRARQGKGIKDR
jgi:hypothetical protein